ncbi:phage baseplate assembly protein W [Pantoea agglomerans]|jgi:phage baseplate assembly protein W|uniref:GPW/gp25 family protein n=1 Tax=Enterobacter agglomerans TaxID=549 RepID=UPI0013BC8F85|nr:GPW/gp25 family protein [Pantoea agglomerans]MDQ0430973.1 phage baseplate assembly protein W [Pantoea agglomerans]NEG84933.1 phage baseplate protein [Pantoea agglomerans]NEH06706.1 phage baseplate protein [Pantoea agglomerans]
MSNDILKATLGQCWAFPPRFAPDTGVTLTAGVDAVMQSLRVLFMTEPGERIMRESYGGGMHDFIFENITGELLANIQNRIEESILRHEPRALLKDVIIQPDTQDASRLRVQIIVYLSGTDLVETVDGTLNIYDGQTLRLL